jgi:hypothetical protein
LIKVINNLHGCICIIWNSKEIIFTLQK